MATENKILNDVWQELSVGQVSIVRVSGLDFWGFNGASAPTDNTNFIPLTEGYSYGGNEKTFARIAGPDTGLTVTVSVTPII